MKIAMVLSRTPGYSETFFRSKISGLKQQGFIVELFVDHNEPGFDLCDQFILPEKKVSSILPVFCKILFVHPRRLFQFCYKLLNDGKSITEMGKCVYSSLHLLQASNIDWIHFGFATIALGREHVASILGAKLAVSLRGFDITRFPLKHPGCYRILWNHVDKVHVISEALLHDARKNGLPASVSYKRITPAVDTKYFSNNFKIHSIQTPVRLLSVARLHWVKGLEYTFEALARLKHLGYAFKYTIIGSGAELDRLILAADQLGVLENVNFAGRIAHTDLIGYYEQADIYLQYSVQEGFCNAVLEAQAVGLPCIVSDAGGLPENVINEKTGWVVPRRQPALLADKISEVLKLNPVVLEQICNNAKILVNRDFNLEKQKQEFAEFYSSS